MLSFKRPNKSCTSLQMILHRFFLLFFVACVAEQFHDYDYEHPMALFKAGTLGCEECTAVLIIAKDYIGSEVNLERYNEGIDKGCAALVPPLDSQCVDILKTRFATDILGIIVALGENYHPQLVCALIGMCHPPNSAALPPNPSAALATHHNLSRCLMMFNGTAEFEGFFVNHIFCSLCTIVLGTVKGLIKDVISEELVKEGLDTGCDMVPWPLSTACRRVLEPLLDGIFNIIQNLGKDFDIGVACARIGICDNSAFGIRKVIEMSYMNRSFGSLSPRTYIGCDSCTIVLLRIKALVQTKPATEELVGKGTEEGCKEFKQPYVDACQNLMNENEMQDKVLKAIQEAGSDFVPESICKVTDTC